ncbi:slit homolog 3 protein-like [Patiria miniata]|uniref:LRRCT domain-containing protein n=1 Tax=Patiria miniata TaxID=46514 RepID=A0A913ZIJ7_PATMI|nr:slit homolog 3 protein-like [Patiria miniata]
MQSRPSFFNMARVHTVVLLLLCQAFLMFHPVLAVSERTDPNSPPTTYGECLQECQSDTDVRCIACGLDTIPTTPDCKRATTLELASNDIRELRLGVFAGFNELSILVLTDNEIRDIPRGVLSDLGTLTALYVDWNNLTSLREGAFEGLVSLRDRLILTGNQITRITTGVFNTLTLTPILAVDSNHIESIQPGAFQGMAKLSTLLLGKNRISSIASGTFSELGKLRMLDLSYNRIETLEGGAFEGLVSLQELKLNSNRIISVAAIESLPRLSHLTLADNEIESLGDNRFLESKLQEKEFTVTFQKNPLRCSCSVEWLRLWYRKHETTDEEKAMCAAPAEYEGRLLTDIHTPLPCKRPAVATTSNPLMDALNPNQAEPLLNTTMSIIVTIVALGLIILAIGTYLVLRRYRRKMGAHREAEKDDEAPEPGPEDPNLASGYSTFVERDTDAAGDSLIGQTTAPHPPPMANGHVFHETEQEETSSFLPSHNYLPVKELNSPREPLQPRVPSTMAPPPPVNSTVSPVNSPVSSLEPDVVCRIDFDERGSMVITTPESELDEGNMEPTDQFICPEEVKYAKLDHFRPTQSSSRPCNGGYIAPRDLAGYPT